MARAASSMRPSRNRSVTPKKARAAFFSSIPEERETSMMSGMSSSAALECGLAFGLNELFDLGLSKWEIIKLSQKAEHDFVGTKCGIMDQFASVMGKMNHVMLLDCMTLDFDYIPMDLAPYRILLLNTNVAHNLASSEYNDRRAQCEKGLAILQEHFGRDISLRDVTPSMLDQCKETMGKTIYNRCVDYLSTLRSKRSL